VADSDLLRVNGDRMWNNLVELGGVGKGNKGVSRIAFSEEDSKGRKWLVEKMRQIGFETELDYAGNVFGRLASKDASKKPAILVGSHLDTVPQGGMFDGALGVLAGLECIQTIKEKALRLMHPIVVVAFSNEEGSSVGPGLFGSRFYTGEVDENEWERVRPFLKKAGFLPDKCEENFPLPSFKRDDYLVYLELHVEQGGVLDRWGENLGVVQGIVWIHSFSAKFLGEANHAGTTPMDQRHDALQGASVLILDIPEIVKKLGSATSVGTCGQITVAPGGRNIIPGEAEITVEVRDQDKAVADRIIEALRERARQIASERGLRVELTEVSKSPGAKMDPFIQDVIEACSKKLGLKARRMPSGAGHDAAVLAKYLRTGMIFVPSKGGISHSPGEWTEKEDCVNGANVLLQTILQLDKSF